MNYYKYLPPERNSYFEDELLRFTQPGDLNDPFECLPRKIDTEKLKETLVRNLKRIIPTAKINEKVDDIAPDFINNANKTTNNILGIFSLSKNWNNGLMWGHYTLSHKGFVIGFDSEHPFFNEFTNNKKKEFKKIREVIYSNERAEIKVDNIRSLPDIEIYLTKSIDWAYEEEIRLISSLNLKHTVKEKEPYDINLFKVPHKMITEIILGVNINDTLKNKIITFCKKNNITLFQAGISETDFSIVRTSVLE